MENKVMLNDYQQHEKRKTLAAPWKNREEFNLVYQWLYSPSASKETKQRACKRITIWKARRLNLTPAAVLGTLVVVEVQLKDDDNSNDKQSVYDLQIMYSSALTRFLNYMSSIMQTRKLRSMYETAKELGLETFIVDLRHICAHGQTMPSLDMFRRTLEYCINWLKGYYWDSELENMRDCDSKNIRQKERTEFDENVTALFEIYDVALESAFRGADKMVIVKNRLIKSKYELLHKYSEEKNELCVQVLLDLCVKDLSALIRRDPGLKDLPAIYIGALLKMKYFFEFSASITTCDEIKLAVNINRQLFRSIATFGFIEDLFHRLIEICENNFEEVYRCKGASFWANQIVNGFIAFKNFKAYYKSEKDMDPDVIYDLSTINTQTIAKDVLNIYSKLNIDIEKTLIFGDTFRRPWFLQFDRCYIEQRVSNVNEFTAEILKNCLHLVVPSISNDKLYSLISLIDIFLLSIGNKCETNSNNRKIDACKIYTIKDLMNQPNSDDVEMREFDSNRKDEKFGIWTLESDGQDWESCPLGRLIWE